MRRMLVTLAIAVVWTAATAHPASAHGLSGVESTNYRTTLKSVTPRVPGLRVRVIETGSRFELSNATRNEVTVLGYQDEPYLRIGPTGVYENRNSPATYLNANRTGSTPVPADAGPKAVPDWRKVSSGHVARWHDHRIHWMGNQDPPAVRRAPGRTHVVIPEWTIEMRMDGRRIAATGDLVWVPGPSPLPWLALAVVLAAGVAALALTPVWARAVAVVVAALVALDLVHAVGIGFAGAGSVGAKLGQVAGGSFYSLVAWPVGVVAVWLLARGRPEGLFPAGFVGAFVALAGGLADVTDLTRSQVPFSWGAGLARLLVSASLGLGIGLVAAAVLGLRRHPVVSEGATTAPVDEGVRPRGSGTSPTSATT